MSTSRFKGLSTERGYAVKPTGRMFRKRLRTDRLVPYHREGHTPIEGVN
jgi:hypothetical protein